MVEAKYVYFYMFSINTNLSFFFFLNGDNVMGKFKLNGLYPSPAMSEKEKKIPWMHKNVLF